MRHSESIEARRSYSRFVWAANRCPGRFPRPERYGRFLWKVLMVPMTPLVAMVPMVVMVLVAPIFFMLPIVPMVPMLLMAPMVHMALMAPMVFWFP